MKFDWYRKFFNKRNLKIFYEVVMLGIGVNLFIICSF